MQKDKKPLINNKNFFVVQAFMVNKLELKGNDLMIYAIIHGFSQETGSNSEKFTGSIRYLSDFTGASRRTVMDSLKKLTTWGYIEKITEDRNGVTFNSYRTIDDIDPILKLMEVVQISHGGGAESARGGGAEIAPNNIDIYNIENNIELSNTFIIPNIDTKEELSTITASASAREPETEFEPEEEDSKAEMSAKEKKWYAHQVEKFGLENNQKPFISDLTNFYYPIDEMYLPIPKSAYSAKFRAKYPPLLPEHRWRIERYEELLALNPTNQAGAQTAFEHECYQYIDWKSVRSNRGVKPISVDEITEDYLAEMPHSNRATWLYMGLKYEFVGASSNRLKFTEVKVPVFPLSYLKQCDFARLGAYLGVASKIPNYHEVITKLIEEKKQSRKK